MSSGATRRIQKELVDLGKAGLESVTAGPEGDDLFKWKAQVRGPKGSPYEGGTFALAITFPQAYPFKPPKVVFLTKIYHPNVDDKGDICVATLKTEVWKPATRLTDVFNAVLSMLLVPNPEDALESSIAQVYRENHAQYVKTAKEWMDKYKAK